MSIYQAERHRKKSDADAVGQNQVPQGSKKKDLRASPTPTPTRQSHLIRARTAIYRSLLEKIVMTSGDEREAVERLEHWLRQAEIELP